MKAIIILVAVVVGADFCSVHAGDLSDLPIEEKIRFLANESIENIHPDSSESLKKHYENLVSDPLSMLNWDWDSAKPLEKRTMLMYLPYVTGSRLGYPQEDVYPFHFWSNRTKDHEIFPELALKFRLEYLRGLFEKVEAADEDTYFSNNDRRIFHGFKGAFNPLTRDMDLWEFPDELVQLHWNAESMAEVMFAKPLEQNAHNWSADQALEYWGNGVQHLANYAIWREQSVLGLIFPELAALRSESIQLLKERGLSVEEMRSVPDELVTEVRRFLKQSKGELSDGKMELLRVFVREELGLKSFSGPRSEEFLSSETLTSAELLNQIEDIDTVIERTLEAINSDQIYDLASSWLGDAVEVSGAVR